MAEVDFSNAIFTIVAGSGATSTNPILSSDLALNNRTLWDATGNAISSSSSTATKIQSENTIQKISYSGEFTASGTEFYISTAPSNIRYKVSNISFNSGDSYSFSVRADLTCE